jgi:hypothetical protein
MYFKSIIHTTKGIIRDQKVRRGAMFILVLAALLMAFAGSTFLNGWLVADKWTFLIYWLVCAWLTMTAMLLALFDMLAVRLLLRREQRRLKKKTFSGHDSADDKED